MFVWAFMALHGTKAVFLQPTCQARPWQQRQEYRPYFSLTRERRLPSSHPGTYFTYTTNQHIWTDALTSVPPRPQGRWPHSQYAHMAAWAPRRARHRTGLLWLWGHTQLLLDEEAWLKLWFPCQASTTIVRTSTYSSSALNIVFRYSASSGYSPMALVSSTRYYSNQLANRNWRQNQ